MKKYPIRRMISYLVILLIMITPVQGLAESLDIEARSYWLYETSTGKVLAESHSDQVTAAASLTKLMTCLLTLEAVERGEITWDEVITLPDSYVNPGGSSMDLRAGQTVTIRQVLSGLLIVSANDGAKLLAARLSGNEEDFVRRMNTRAQELGMKKTLFLNPSGLPEKTGQNMTTASDMGMLSNYLLTHYQEFLLGITGQRTHTDYARNYSKPTTNTLMHLKKGVDGLKTGHTNDAGYCLAATMPFGSDGDARLIAVVMGTADEGSRNEAGRKLLDWADETFDFTAVIDEEDRYPLGYYRGLESRPVYGHPAESVARLIRTQPGTRITTSALLPAKLPLKAGDPIGTVTAVLWDGETVTVPLLSDTEILRLSWGERFSALLQSVGSWFRSILPS